jgi:hypothetical protein
MKFVRINTDDTMNEITVKQSPKNILTTLTKLANSSGSSKIQELYCWNFNGETVHCYGWYEGEVGFENKHDLIPGGISDFLEEDSSEKLLFGDIFLVKKNKQKNLINFLVSDYANMYSELFEGFDDCVSEDGEEESESEDEEDTDFIVPDSAEESEDSYEYKEDDELGTDENEY